MNLINVALKSKSKKETKAQDRVDSFEADPANYSSEKEKGLTVTFQALAILFLYNSNKKKSFHSRDVVIR